MDGAPKYLTYVPWEGQLNNTRMCFEVALILATLANRLLVLPDSYRRLHDTDADPELFRPLHPRDFLDFAAIDSSLQTISNTEYLARRTSSAATVELRFEPGAAVFCHPGIPAAGSAAAARLLGFASGRTQFLEFTPAMHACETLHIAQPTLEQFYTFFHFHDAGEERACRRFIRDYVALRPEIMNLGRDTAASLGPYNAAHIRRGDFLEQFPEQALPAARILDSLQAHFPQDVPLYVATDETDSRFFEPLQRHFQVYRAADVLDVPVLEPEILACVEQAVCAFGHRFIGTRLSTFSAYITRLRGYLGAPDQEIRFTDGSWTPELDNPAEGRCSWDNWFRSGRPLWGREFREAWECDES